MTLFNTKQDQVRHCDNSRANQAFRTGVYTQRSEGWYFNTREGIEFGPYESFAMVKQARAHFVASIANNQDQSSASYSSSLLFLETIEL